MASPENSYKQVSIKYTVPEPISYSNNDGINYSILSTEEVIELVSDYFSKHILSYFQIHFDKYHYNKVSK